MRRKKHINIEKMYKFYLKQKEKTKIINGKKYYLLAGYEKVDLGEIKTFVMYINSLIPFKIGDTLIDENSNEYKIVGVEMIHYTNKRPILHSILSAVHTEPQLNTLVGKYITLK